jgi:hypothetical protein
MFLLIQSPRLLTIFSPNQSCPEYRVAKSFSFHTPINANPTGEYYQVGEGGFPL